MQTEDKVKEKKQIFPLPCRGAANPMAVRTFFLPQRAVCHEKTLILHETKDTNSQGVKIKDVIGTLEQFAPLPLQDGYDNAGLQVGLTEAEVSGVLLCLDVTETVLDEAAAKGCNLVVAHHPLLFNPLRQVGNGSFVERCVRTAVKRDITVYAAHTNLDNAMGGVSFEMASRLGLTEAEYLLPNERCGGSGVIARLAAPVTAGDFVRKVKETFGVETAMCNELLTRPVERVALCGGAGDFLLSAAVAKGADAFVTGEMHYHRYFGCEQQIQIIVTGHYQSERFTMELMKRLIEANFPGINAAITECNTNPILYI